MRARTMLWSLVAIALIGNLGFAWLVGRSTGEPLLSGHPGQSDRLILVADAGGGRVLAADAANRLLLYEGGQVTHEVQFETLIGGIAVAGDRIFAGLADGRVVRLDGELRQTGGFGVEGRVVGLRVTAGGEIAVAHGQGAYSGRYFVSLFGGDAGDLVLTQPAEFTITALEVAGEAAIYGTLNARVGKLDAGGSAWVTRLSQPVTRLLALPDGEILAGGDRGALTRLSATGEIIAETHLGDYPIRGLAVDERTGSIFAGDAQGTLYVLDDGGGVRLSRQVADVDVEAVLPAGDGTMLVVPRDGVWSTLNPGAIEATRRAERLRVAWYSADAVLLVALGVAAVAAVERWRIASARRLRAIGRARLAYAFLLPAIGLIVLFSYYPAGLAGYYSLTTFSLRNPTEFIGFRNYVDILTNDRYFRTGVVNLVIIVVTSVAKTVTVPLLTAELVFWLRNETHRYVFRTLFILPAVVPDLVFTLMWRQVYDPYTGLLNQFLGVVGLGSWQRAWLGDERTALWAVVGVGFPFVSAFAFLILLGGLLTINRDYFDAARVDGAGRWARFRHIDLPLLLPQFRILLFFAVTGTIQGFAAIFILTRGGPGTATYVPALQMYQRIGEGDFGYASAIGVVLFAVILVLTLFVLRFRRQDAVEAV